MLIKHTFEHKLKNINTYINDLKNIKMYYFF